MVAGIHPVHQILTADATVAAAVSSPYVNTNTITNTNTNTNTNTKAGSKLATFLGNFQIFSLFAKQLDYLIGSFNCHWLWSYLLSA